MTPHDNDTSSDVTSALESALGGAGKTPKSGWLSTVLAEDFDVWKAVGGVRGLAETILPSIVFIVVYTATKELLPSVIAPLAVAIGALLVRLMQRIDIVPALGGLVGIAFSVVWAWRSGEVSNYFALGLVTNAGYAVLLLVSLAVRWPALGLVIGMLRGDATGWRQDPLTRRRYTQVTWLWVALFVARIAVQGPLYLAGATTALAVARLIMGPFIYALVAWLSWLMVRGLPPVRRGEDAPGTTETREA
ncbi:DUF3159 domain-containing protein [Arcanobacterium haemolyticum]|nr:DUF3159 domain-containing protein [Arcanobacterium haemolyticum]